MQAHSEIVKAFERAGFRLVRANKHEVWACPCGHRLVTVPRTPCKGNRSGRNTMALLKNTIAACTTNPEARAA